MGRTQKKSRAVLALDRLCAEDPEIAALDAEVTARVEAEVAYEQAMAEQGRTIPPEAYEEGPWLDDDAEPADDLVCRVLARLAYRLGVEPPLGLIGAFMRADPRGNRSGTDEPRPVNRERVRQIEASALRKLRRNKGEFERFREMVEANRAPEAEGFTWPEAIHVGREETNRRARTQSEPTGSERSCIGSQRGIRQAQCRQVDASQAQPLCPGPCAPRVEPSSTGLRAR